MTAVVINSDLQGRLNRMNPVAAEVSLGDLLVALQAIAPVSQQAAVPTLIDSSGGASGGNTIAAIALPVASATGADTVTLATAASVITSNTALRNAVSTLSAKLDAVIAVLHASGVTE